MNDNYEDLSLQTTRRVRLRWQTGLLLAALLILIVGLAAYSSGTAQGQQEVLSALAQQEEEPEPEPAPPSITGDILLQQLTAVPQLISAEYHYTNMGKFEDQTDFYGWPVPFTTKRFIVSYNGRIQAGLADLEAVVLAVDEESRTVTVTLPPCQILSHEIFEDSLEVFDETSSIFNPVKIEDYAGFTLDQKQAVEQKAVDSGLLDSADAQAREAVTALLGALPCMEDYTLVVR